jgi:Fe-S cluster assembly protein SufD
MTTTWLESRRAQARSVYEQTPLPTLKDENWRYTSLREIDFGAFGDPAEAAADATVATLLADVVDAGSALVQRGATVVHERSASDVAVCSLEAAAARGDDVVERHLGTVVPLDDRFVAENAATWRGGALVHVRAGVDVERPVHLTVEVPTDGARTVWRVLVVAEPGSRITVVEELARGRAGYLNGVVELVVGDGAHVTYLRTQDLDRETYHFTAARAEIGRDATVEWSALELGGRLGKSRMESRLAGAGGTVRVTGLYALDGSQHLDLDTSQEHAAPNATSDLAFKGALRGRSRSVWRGVIKVDEGAQKTDAFQENRNLLLSPRAHADSIPGLEILANDVRCTHAATVSQVDRELLFFLQSRGFERAEAERMLVHGFFADALARVADEQVRERLDAALSSLAD